MSDYAELCSDTTCGECYRCLSRQDYAALTASQADVSRLSIELASTRSQLEASVSLRKEAERAQGDAACDRDTARAEVETLRAERDNNAINATMDIEGLRAEVAGLRADNQRYAHAIAEQGEIETELRQDERSLEVERDGLREALDRCAFDGEIQEEDGSTTRACGTCGTRAPDCDDIDGSDDSDECPGRIARRALSISTGTRAGEACRAFQPYPNPHRCYVCGGTKVEHERARTAAAAENPQAERPIEWLSGCPDCGEEPEEWSAMSEFSCAGCGKTLTTEVREDETGKHWSFPLAFDDGVAVPSVTGEGE